MESILINSSFQRISKKILFALDFRLNDFFVVVIVVAAGRDKSSLHA